MRCKVTKNCYTMTRATTTIVNSIIILRILNTHLTKYNLPTYINDSINKQNLTIAIENSEVDVVDIICILRIIIEEDV